MASKAFRGVAAVLRAMGRLAAKTGIIKDVPNYRPDVADLIGPEWDHDSQTPANKTLIICAAQRTGSYELCRFLTAAGLGVPHEYFHPVFAKRLMTRWALIDNPLSEVGLGSYVELLRKRRAFGGIFSTKLQYWQFDTFLRNRHGAALFEEACVIHLFRPDIAAQFASFHAALQTDQWDFSRPGDSIPISFEADSSTQTLLNEIEMLVEEDAGFRRLFALLNIRPLFLNMEELFDDPYRVIKSIACKAGVEINKAALYRIVRISSPYPRPPSTLDGPMTEVRENLKQYLFSNPRRPNHL